MPEVACDVVFLHGMHWGRCSYLQIRGVERLLMTANLDGAQPDKPDDQVPTGSGETVTTATDSPTVSTNDIPVESPHPTESAAHPVGAKLGTAQEASTMASMGRGGGLNIRDLRTFSSLKNGQFRLYYGAMLGQMAAMNMQMIVRSLLIFRITGSATYLGLLALANASPMLALSLFGGVLADRVAKKQVLIGGQAVSGILTLAVAICLSRGILTEETWWILLVAAVGQGIVMDLMMPARQAMIFDIVGGSQLMNAVALNTLGMNALRLIAPATSGFLIAYFGGNMDGIIGFDAVYYVMTVFYLIAVIFIIPMQETGFTSLKGKGAIGDIRDALIYVRNNPTLLLILAVTFVTVLFSMPYMMLLPVVTEEVLHVGAKGLGILVSVSGIGAMAGSLVLASLPSKHRGLIMLLGSLLLGVALIFFSFSTSWYLSLGAIVFVGLGQTTRMTLGNTLLQDYVEDEYRGRVMALYMMEFGLTSFAVFLCGLVAEQVGISWALGSFAIILVVCCIYMIAFMPKMRRLQ